MNWLLFNYEFPPIGGGAGRASYELAAALVSQGHHVRVVTTAFSGLPARETLANGVHVVRIPSTRRSAYAASIWEMLSYVFQARRALPAILGESPLPQIVLSFFTVPSGLVGNEAARRLKIPHVISLRGMDVPGFDAPNLRLHHLLSGPIVSYLWRRAALLIPVSSSLGEKARRHALRTRMNLPPCRVIGNGISSLPVVQRPRSRETPQLLAVGRLAPQKNHALLIEALSAQRFRNLPWKMEIIGDGPLRGALAEQIQKAGLQERIHLAGWKTHAQVQEKFRTADLLIHPSVDEGMSNVLLEGLAAGILILASRVGDNAALLEEGKSGLLFDAGDLVELVSKLDEGFSLLQETSRPALTQIEQAARAQVGKRSWNDLAKALAKTTQEICLGESATIPSSSKAGAYNQRRS